MVAVADTFCIDRYEASRSDATAASAGTDDSAAKSISGVIPWQVADNASAEAACMALGKRLCRPAEWQLACAGPDRTVYGYGNTYEPTTCNGIDTYGRDAFHLMPTGSFADCKSEWGAFDLNGNLWEHVAGGSDKSIRGGAYNCSDSATLHRCDYIPGSWTPSARGFRCCLTPTMSEEDGGADGGSAGDGATAGDGGSGSGCINEDGGDASPGIEARDGGDRGADSADGDGDTGSGADAGGTDGDVVPTGCPPDMVPAGQFCIDRYEASRQDADATSSGTDDSIAVSRAGVLPWYARPISSAALAVFDAACHAAGKRLCSSTEWTDVCRGPAGSTYVFGNTWDASLCNSVDTFCQSCCSILGMVTCPTAENCGYSSALSSFPFLPETCFISAPYGLSTCHVCFHVMPTGSFPLCTNSLGADDMNGNVWETVRVPTTEDGRGYKVLGGAFNCGSPSLRFQCTYNATWTDLYAGFRCCKDRNLP
jgi:formylglycine-generating enzyme required for sulfatase activity